MIDSLRRSLALAVTAATLLVLLVAPTWAFAHAALTASDPADNGSVAGPFSGPITLTFSEALQAGSHAELLDSGGTKVADALVADVKLTFTPSAALTPGAWTIQWTSVAADKDVARGTVTFTVTQPTPAPATPTPVPATPTRAPTSAATATAAASSVPAASPAGSAAATKAPAASATPSGGNAASSGGDVILPIVVGLALVGLVAAALLRKRASS